MIQGKKTGSTQLLFAARAQAAAQGRVRPTLLTQLHPFVAAAGFVLRLFRSGRAETRPPFRQAQGPEPVAGAAGNHGRARLRANARTTSTGGNRNGLNTH